jgi:hypothetical protein
LAPFICVDGLGAVASAELPQVWPRVNQFSSLHVLERPKVSFSL